jgi:nucleotide-binding universal stress UspA family protein
MDGSTESLDALARGLALLGEKQATLFVVVDKSMAQAPKEVVEEFAADEKDEVFPTDESALAVLRDARKRVPKGVKLSLKIARGNVAAEIVKESAGYDVLVMHASKHGGFFRKAGAHAIARKASCNVLLVATKA